MNWRHVLTVYRKELTDSLRDRRTLVSTIVIPTFLMPALLLLVGSVGSRVVTQAQAEVLSVSVLGGDDSPAAVAALRASPKLRLVPAGDDWRARISDKKLRAAVELPAGFDAGLGAGSTPAVKIYHYQGELRSGLAAAEIDAVFRELRERTVAARLAARGLAPDFIRPFETRRENVAPPEKVGGNLLGGLVPYLIIALCFTGAMYPAMDLTAGEKERGTMETLLCSPVARVDLVLGKFLMVLTGSLGAMACSLASMGASLAAGGALFAEGGTSSSGALAAVSAIHAWGLLGVLAMVLPVSVLFSALVFTIALFAKTYKEAQSYIAPMAIVVILPAIFGMLPGIELDWRLALVPILNLSLVCKEMLSGVWSWPYIALIFASTSVYAAAALALAVRMFERESVMFRG